MRVHPTKTDAPRTDSGTAFYRLKLGRNTFAPRWWPSWLLLLFLRLSALLPLRASRLLGATLGLLIYALNAKRRHIARVNLKLCFPDKSDAERADLLRRHFMVKGQSYLDTGFLAWASLRRIRRATHIRGLEHLRAARQRGRNVILLAPHFLGMNFAASVLAREHAEFSMMKLQRNAVVNWLLNKGRMRFGLKLLARTQGLRPVVRTLKEGLAFYYLPDEDFGPRHSVFAPFFGVPTATLTTLGRLAELTDAAVIPCFVRLLPRGRGYEIMLKPPLANYPRGDKQDDAACMNRALEDGIRTHPEQYMWTFKLFKTRPHGAPAPY
ncbi:MAG: lipid A biosynthesis acyltransferase [Gammaproteobacteria bacterium]|nr:MAG: lipid A biosynthesis acyltransferase [Gammaproteobacteria bacterium]